LELFKENKKMVAISINQTIICFMSNFKILLTKLKPNQDYAKEITHEYAVHPIAGAVYMGTRKDSNRKGYFFR
jgi:hypothetical protein